MVFTADKNRLYCYKHYTFTLRVTVPGIYT